MVLTVQKDIEEDDAVPVGSEDCCYRWREADVMELDRSRGGTIEQKGEKGCIWLWTEVGSAEGIGPVFRGFEED